MLDQIKQGVLADEAYEKLERYEKRLEEKRRSLRGRETEFFVANVLRSLPNVRYVAMSQPFSEMDILGIDLVVGLKYVEEVPSVGVQVKSSYKGVDEFNERGGWNKKIIVINGRSGQESIESTFNQGVARIVAHATEAA